MGLVEQVLIGLGVVFTLVVALLRRLGKERKAGEVAGRAAAELEARRSAAEQTRVAKEVRDEVETLDDVDLANRARRWVRNPVE